MSNNNSDKMREDPQSQSDCVWVNLDALVVENKGAEIATHPTLGRVVIASKSLGQELLFQSIVREIPALICQQQDYMDYMEHFLDAPETIQMGIFDMFHPSLDSTMGKSLLEPAKLLFMLGLLEDFTVIHQLLTILETNGHQYRDGRSALPLFGSKFQHSCSPDVGYCYENEGSNTIDYILLRCVEKGELLSHSYLTDLFETPTQERRQILKGTKDFICACQRCVGPDFLRCLPCPTCSTLVPCQYIQSTEDHAKTFKEYWECLKCGLLESGPFLVMEESYSRLLNTVEETIEQTTSRERTSEYSPSVLQKLVTICRKELSLTHHLTIKALRLLVLSATASGYVQLQKLMVRSQSLHGAFLSFRMSAEAGIQIVQAGECVAAGCCSCQRVFEGDDGETCQQKEESKQHPPQCDRSLVVKHVYESLMQLPVFYWPSQAVTMILCYLPILQARYGDGMIMKGVLMDQTCLECGTYWNPFAHIHEDLR